jgi:hypothetical protein
MASQGDPTRVGGTTPPAPPQAAPADRGIDLTTLVLSAIASAAAAYVTSKIWARGTLLSAAMSPVIVALVKEGLRKPTEVITNVVPNVVPAPSRWARTSAGDPGLVAEPHPGTPPAPPPGEARPSRDPHAPHVVLPPVVATGHAPVSVYSTRARRLRWRLAVITGLLGFGVCVLLYTVPELIAGESIGGSHKTTIFGGHRKSTNHSTTTTTSTTPTTQTTPTTTEKTTTVTRTQTVTTPAPAPTPTTTTPTPTTTAPTTPTPPAAAAPQGAVPAPEQQATP